VTDEKLRLLRAHIAFCSVCAGANRRANDSKAARNIVIQHIVNNPKAASKALSRSE
jgi:hypothetical protein